MAYLSNGIQLYWATSTIVGWSTEQIVWSTSDPVWSDTSIEWYALKNKMTEVGDVISFRGPTMSANPIDVTHTLSTAKTKIVGVYNGGNISIELNMGVSDSGQSKMRESFYAHKRSGLMIEVTDSNLFRMDGYVNFKELSGKVDDSLHASVKMEICGGVAIST